MFKDKKDKNKKSYQSFDSWVSDLKKSANEFIEEIEEEIEEEEKKKKSYEASGKKTVFRKFSDNKDVKEIFPRDKSMQKEANKYGKKTSGMDKRSHEGKVNSKGSIAGDGQMGREGDPINPDLRKRLEEKRRKDLHQSRSLSSNTNKGYKRKSVKKAEKHQKISNLKQEFKNKDELRKTIILSEILAPPISKRKKH